MRRYSLARLGHLINTSLHILRQDGPKAFGERLVRWLRGERRYMRQIMPDQPAPSEHTILIEQASKQVESHHVEPPPPPPQEPHVEFAEDRPELHGYEPYCRLMTPSENDLAAQRDEALTWQNPPCFGIITTVYDLPLYHFRRTVTSVLKQSCPHWRWYVVDASQSDALWQYITFLAQQDERIVPIRQADAPEAVALLNRALKQVHEEALCDYVVLLDPDDTLALEALYTVSRFVQIEQPGADFIYSDEDKINEQDHRSEPFFKPDWSPELLLSVNYMRYISVIKRTVLERVGAFDPRKNGAHHWDLFLRISEITNHIHRIPRVLYHVRKRPEGSEVTSAVAQAQLEAIREHLERTGIPQPQVSFEAQHPSYGKYPVVTWEQSQPRRIVIIIPSRDKADILLGCLASIFEYTRYPDYRVIVVDTGSREQATFDLYARYQHNARFQVVNYTDEFNFNKVCNLGAHHAPDADLLLFLNNDTEVLDGMWLARMAQWFEREGVGIVGAKLLYPDGTIQHGGVYIGGEGLAFHLFVRQPITAEGVFGSACWYRNLLAVTGACMMISREVFERVGGFDEAYQVSYSDVTLCLRAYQMGYRIIFTPHALLMHYESLTRGLHNLRSDLLRANDDFQEWIQKGDPYYHPNLSCSMLDHQVTLSPAHQARNLNRWLMAQIIKREQ
ncbi:MAG: hypothetical protein CUN51_04995 [Candidatus Thermofonsia Clade 1 bacterium]|uniref:Glycosyltransferase 2-like domain-containing protein n=1 Tax=Candidatus Thermofonsia Clade 1 bacterium TaxID=2364210 RepID=A0A2M8P0Z7_9CHLR|nr:MAG: hypothetical protein CUN51_04995 [Candidatus Thermofonsia Clade 1 bacterium]